MSAFPFSQDSDVPTAPSAKRANLGSAVSYARARASSRMALSPGQETLMLGMQGSLNLLTSSISSSLQPVTPTAQLVSEKCAQALQMLKLQDDDLPRPLKTFIWTMIAHDSGFVDVYLLTEDKVERLKYVTLEYTGKTGNFGTLA